MLRQRGPGAARTTQYDSGRLRGTRHPRRAPAGRSIADRTHGTLSRGGQAGRYLRVLKDSTSHEQINVGLAAYIPFYPDCMTTYQSDTEVTDTINAPPALPTITIPWQRARPVGATAEWRTRRPETERIARVRRCLFGSLTPSVVENTKQYADARFVRRQRATNQRGHQAAFYLQ